MAFTKEDIEAILAKAIDSEFPSTPAAPVVNADLAKSIAQLNAKIDKVADLAINGYQKPKTQEELFADLGKQLTASIGELAKTLKPAVETKPEDQPIPTTIGGLKEVLKAALAEMGKATPVEKETPKGQGKELGKEADALIEGMTESDVITMAKDLLSKDEGSEGVVISEHLAREVAKSEGKMTPAQVAKTAQLDEYLVNKIANKGGVAASDEDDDE